VWGPTDPLTPLVLSDKERRLRFRGLPQAVRAARRVLWEWESHFEPDLFYDLSLCVSELVTNGVQHGEPTTEDEIELAVWRSEALVHAEIRVRWSNAVVSQPSAIAPDWGLFIIDRVADRWGVDHSAGTLVWCEIDLASDARSRDRRAMGMALSAVAA
jgi:Histidine kinase-like ATPase domain